MLAAEPLAVPAARDLQRDDRARELNVYESVNREVPFDGLHWFIDHRGDDFAKENIERIRALGGGIAVQHRMAYQGQDYINRYGKAAAETSPPIQKRMLAARCAGRRRHRCDARCQL